MAEFRNPNLQTQGGDSGGGGDMRGLMAVTLLVFVLVLGFQLISKPRQSAASQSQNSAQNSAQNRPQSAPPAGQSSGQSASQAQPQLASVSGPGAVSGVPQPQVAAAAESLTTVENGNYKIVFTNRGAQVKHWILKHYNDSAGKPLDLVQQQASAYFGLPLSLYTYEPALNEELNKAALYQLTASGAQPSETGLAHVPQTSALTFHYAANGLDVVKTVRFDAGYVITVEARVTRNGAPVRALVAWPAGLGDMEEFQPGVGHGKRSSVVPASANSIFAWSAYGKQDSIKAKAVSGNATLDLPYEYAAIADLYFAAAFLPDAPERATVVTLHNAIDLPADPSDPNSQRKPADVIGLAAGDSSGSTRLRLYAGPKETDLLKTVHASGADGKPNGPTLESLIQFGSWLGVIAKPLYLAIRGLRGWLGPGANNWGWAIILVTVIFNLLMLPTRFMMMKSSLKMMRIQPKVDAIKARYKNLKAADPKRAEMNNEMMALYKTEDVSLHGGCLPMLIQMPLFFAYYRVLSNAVELRQAHWFWLTDLAAPDPLYILFAIIIICMPLTQLITPSPGMDPGQRRMMAFMMPVMMGFILLRLPSGLGLYWATGNIINLAIQIGINQSSMGREMHEIAARRAAKKSGGANSGPIQKRR